MADEDDPLVARHRRENWRRQWINKFRECQRTARRWIEFVEIAKWCAQSTTGTSVEGEQEAFALAYQRLADSVLQREFEVEGRSKILYLDPRVRTIGTSPYRLTRDWFGSVLQATAQFDQWFQIAATRGTSHLPMNVLVDCWVPHDLARRWLAAHGYRWAPQFDPVQKRLVPVMPTDVRSRLAASNGEEAVYRTGLAGRPTTWNLIELECRDRYAQGERHPTRAEWARVLITWLQPEHKKAPAVQPKTLTNKLGTLLRELEANEVPSANYRQRPK